MIFFNCNKQAGQSLVEVILATSILAVLTTVFTFAFIYGNETAILAGSQNRASLLAEEGLEVVRNIRDENFNNLQDGNFGLEISGGQWQLVPGADTMDIYTRQITISSVGDSTSTKDVSSTVTWQQNLQRTGSVTLNARFFNWR